MDAAPTNFACDSSSTARDPRPALGPLAADPAGPVAVGCAVQPTVAVGDRCAAAGVPPAATDAPSPDVAPKPPQPAPNDEAAPSDAAVSVPVDAAPAAQPLQAAGCSSGGRAAAPQAADGAAGTASPPERAAGDVLRAAVPPTAGSAAPPALAAGEQRVDVAHVAFNRLSSGSDGMPLVVGEALSAMRVDGVATSRRPRVAVFSEIDRQPLDCMVAALRTHGFDAHHARMDAASRSAGRGCNLLAWDRIVFDCAGRGSHDFACVENGARKTFCFPCVDLVHQATGRPLHVVAVHLTPRTLHAALLRWVEGLAFSVDALVVGDFNLQYLGVRAWNAVAANTRYHWAWDARRSGVPDALAAYSTHAAGARGVMAVRVRRPLVATAGDYPNLVRKTDHPQVLRLRVAFPAAACTLPVPARGGGFAPSSGVASAGQLADNATRTCAELRSREAPSAVSASAAADAHAHDDGRGHDDADHHVHHHTQQEGARPADGAPPPPVVYTTRSTVNDNVHQ